MRLLAFVLLHGLGGLQAGPQDLAWLENERVVLHEGERLVEWPGTQGAETFGWDRGGRSLLVTRTGRLQRIAPDGRRSTLVHGFEEVRFPDVCAADGRIAFACRLEGSQASEWQLRVIEADGRGNLELGPGYDPAFLPDGSGLVFECFEESGPDLWIHHFDTRARRRLFAEGERRYTPAVSGDGTMVAFSTGGRLRLADIATGAARDLSPQGATYDRFASFAPDGASVAFFRERGGRAALVLREIAGGERDLPGSARATLPLFRPARPLPVFLALTPAVAAPLVAAAGRGALDFPDLETLDSETARVLAGAKGSLRLDGLARIDLATAEALAEWGGNGESVYLSLDGLRAPAPEILAALARTPGWGLSLGQIERLTADSLAALAPFRGAALRLRGLNELDTSAAEVVAATWNAKWLEVDFETSVSAAARDAMGAGRVVLRGAGP